MTEKTYREKVEEKASAEKKRQTKKKHGKGKLSWSGYLEMSDHPKIKHGTEQAKTVLEEMLPQFLDGLDERLEGEREWWTAQGAKYPDKKEWRYLMTGFYFFKWLGQMPLFDEANDPGRPIPLVMVWLNGEGKLGFVHNFIGKPVDNMISVAGVINPMMRHIREYFEKEKRRIRKWQRKQPSKKK